MHAWIVVDDEPLKMYATDEMRKKGEAFVEAVTDATFEIYLADARGKRPTFSWDVEIYTDGAGDSCVGSTTLRAIDTDCRKMQVMRNHHGEVGLDLR